MFSSYSRHLGTAAGTLVLRMGTDAHLYDDPDDVSIGPLLESRFDSEKAEALKRLLALIAQGADVSSFFPQVVKNVATQSLEVKKLVYLYLLHYAEKRPNEALLSINCFQKDLSDINPLVRAWALRTMAGIRLHVVAPLVVAAVSKCSRDPSIYVRKCAAYAIPKLCDFYRDDNNALQELVDVLLGDSSPAVVGAAAVAFRSVCPNNFLLIAKHYQRLCETLPDVEEWAQIVLIEILLRYVVARHGLVKESILFANSPLHSQPFNGSAAGDGLSSINNGAFVDDRQDFTLSRVLFKYYMGAQEAFLCLPGDTKGSENPLEYPVVTTCLNDDVKILLQCTSPLFWSQNTGVILAAAGLHWILAPVQEVEKIVEPLLFALRSTPASAYVILVNILVFAKTAPSLFAPFYEEFYVSDSDPYATRALKLEILSSVATESSSAAIFEEFQDYVKDPDRRFIADTVAAIGKCAQRHTNLVTSCLEGLLKLVIHESSTRDSFHSSYEENVLVHSIMSIKTIVKQNPGFHEKVIIQLVRCLDKIKDPEARSLIIWMFGEYCSTGSVILKVISSTLKYFAWSFVAEEIETKLQILNAVVKVVLHTEGEHLTLFKKLMSYIVELAANDINYDIRDRARFMSKIVVSKMLPQFPEESAFRSPLDDTYKELSGRLFMRSVTSTSYCSSNLRIFLPGSLSQIVLHAAPGYEPLPKTCSMLDSQLAYVNTGADSMRGISNSFENDSCVSSASSREESGSVYESQDYTSGSEDSGFPSDPNDRNPMPGGMQENWKVPGVHLRGETSKSYVVPCDNSQGVTNFLSKSTLESWLEDQPASSTMVRESPSARISFTQYHLEVKPKINMLLDSADTNGLGVSYVFSLETSTASHLVCVELLFENVSTRPVTNISVKYEESPSNVDPVNKQTENTSIPSALPMEEITLLAPHQVVKRILQVHFHHHLLPLKLIISSDGKKYPAKLQPDMAYFIRPLVIDVKSFISTENTLPGMFEYTRRCTFSDHLRNLEQNDHESVQSDRVLVVAQSFASKILSNSNFHLVSMDMPVTSQVEDASGLRLRFSGEILNTSKPCLITIVAEGKISGPLDAYVKVNSEDAVFAPNLLNRMASILQ